MKHSKVLSPKLAVLGTCYGSLCSSSHDSIPRCAQHSHLPNIKKMVPVTQSAFDNSITFGTIMSYAIRISFHGQSRNVQLAAPVTVAALRAAVASKFEIRTASSRSSDRLCFAYHDTESENITIRLDSELNLALRLCRGMLEIKAMLADGQQDVLETQHQNAHNTGDLYETAAAELKTSHAIPSMTAAKLRRTIALLRLHPRRLVAQGLAPRRLLTHKAARSAMQDNTDDTMDHGHDISDDKQGGKQEATVANGVGGDPIHSAFVSRGVALKPHETAPLLAALGAGPRRLVGVGLVDRRVLRVHMSRSHREAKQHEAGESTDVGDIYDVAAGTLRASHGVSSISGVDLKRTMVLLELPVRRLVFQGLAPRDVVRGESTAVVGESCGEQATGAEAGGAVEETVTREKGGAGDKGSVHAMFVSRGILSVSASEVRPLLRVLGVRPYRLVRLRLVRREAVRPEVARMCGGVRGGLGWGHGGGRGRGMGRSDRSARPGHGMLRCAVPNRRVGVVGEA